MIIGVANVICGEATWSLLIKTASGRFIQLVYNINEQVSLSVCLCLSSHLKKTNDTGYTNLGQVNDWRSQSTPNDVSPNEVLLYEVHQMMFHFISN